MDQIEEIRSKIDIVQLISEFLPLKKAGRNFKGLCPFHTEKTPSFMVSPERQIWHCFGCSAGGDVFGFLMEMERMEFGEALRFLAKRTGVVLQSFRPTQSEADKEKLYQINHLASEFFHYLLLNHQAGKKALDYILQRGISKESLVQFKIGYSPARWDGLQKFLVGKKGFDPKDVEKAGLIIPRQSSTNTQHPSPNTYYDRFRDRLMFPLYDHRGNITGFSGRVLDPTVKEAKYINTPETLVYHKSELLYPLNITKEEVKKSNTAVVVEGELDAISCYQVGIKNVVAIKGSALTEVQARLLKRFCENIVLSLDSDVAGDMASRRGIEIAEKEGLNMRVLTIEKYKDPDETAQKDPEYFKKQLLETQNVYDYYLDSAFKRFRGITAEEKRKIGSELLPIFSKIQDEIVKNVFVQKLAKSLGVSYEAVVLQMEKEKSKTAFIKRTPPQTEIKTDRREVLENYFMSLIFQSKNIDILLNKDDKIITRLVYQKITSFLKNYMEENQVFSSQLFFNFLPAELRDSYDSLYLYDFGNNLEDGRWCREEILRTQNQLEILFVREDLKKLLENLRLSEGKEEGKTDEYREEIKKLIYKLGQLEKDTNN